MEWDRCWEGLLWVESHDDRVGNKGGDDVGDGFGGTAAGVYRIRRLKVGCCGGLKEKALLAPAFCPESFPLPCRTAGCITW